MKAPLTSNVVFTLGPVPITQVVVVTWCVMAAFLLVALLLRHRLRRDKPGGAQQVMEALYEWLASEIRGIVGHDPHPFVPLVGSLFLFILCCNLLGLVSSVMPFMVPPTADINTTTALALVVFLAVPGYGIAMSGARAYLRQYVRPVWIMLPFNVISEISRTVAMAVRLFGNIVSGEILFGVLLSLVPFLLPLPLMFLSLITGTIQAYIFTILAVVYIGGAVGADGRRDNDNEGEETTA